jgi:hypothetical protein
MNKIAVARRADAALPAVHESMHVDADAALD